MEIATTSPGKYARTGGVFYLINIVLGIFSIAYVESVIGVDGNSVATVRNIISHEFLYRLGIVAHIIILLTNFPLALIFYRLFWVVNKNATILVVFFTLVGTAIEAANILNQIAPLLLIKNIVHIDGSSNQMEAYGQVYTFLRLQTAGFHLALIFYACYNLSAGYLIFRSTFLPKFVGILLLAGGLCYLTYSFSSILLPSFADSLVPYIQIPSGIAEITFCLWLLIAGVNVKKWKKKEQIALSKSLVHHD